MILAETLRCTTVSDRPDVGYSAPVWTEVMECDLGPVLEAADSPWQAIAAMATLAAVIVAVWQTRHARAEAKEANESRDKAEERLRQRDADERYRSASRLSVWIETGSSRMPTIEIRNGSEDALYDVTIRNDGIAPLGTATFEILAPGDETKIVLPRFYVMGPKVGKPIEPGLAHVTMTDALGHTYERNPENKGILTETGPCYE